MEPAALWGKKVLGKHNDLIHYVSSIIIIITIITIIIIVTIHAVADVTLSWVAALCTCVLLLFQAAAAVRVSAVQRRGLRFRHMKV